MASQNAVRRAQNTRLAATRSSLMILWVALDMDYEAGGFKVNSAPWFRSDKIPRGMKDLDSGLRAPSVFSHRRHLPEN